MKRNIQNWIVVFFLCTFAVSSIADAFEVLITKHGAVSDAKTLNTKAIQSAIDHVASNGGGTIVVPEGVFVSGALFLKPGVNLRLESGAVLRCSIDMKNFPEQRTRIEGHFEENFNPALINADGCDGLMISGAGTLDGAGKPIWDLFWKLRDGDTEFKNLDVPRARLCMIENSGDVMVKGVTFKDAQFWNLHLYKCRGVRVEGARFVVPDDDIPPSSDGIDVDSCQDVTIQGCIFSVNDDCIALKGTKGPFAMEDKTSPPVELIRISDCVFLRGHGVVTCGSEATVVRDIVVKDCKVTGAMPLVRLKLRPDTPQQYENFLFQNISFESTGATLFEIKKWSQYFDPMGQPEPASIVRNIKVTDITGSIGSLGVIQGNKMTDIRDISLTNIDVRAEYSTLDVTDKVKNLALDGIKMNGKPFLD